MLSGFELRDFLRVEFARLFILRACGCELVCHCLKLFLERLDICILFGKKSAVGFDFGDVFGRERDRLGGNLSFVERSDLVIASVAIVDPVDKVEERLERKKGIRRRHMLVSMDRQIAKLRDADERSPYAFVYAFFKRVLMKQGGQVVLIWHDDCRIRSVDPFYRELQRLSATDGTHGGGSRVDLLCLNASVGEQVVVAVLGFKEIEVHRAS